MTLTQEGYIKRVAERFNLQDAKHVFTATDSAFIEQVLKGVPSEEVRKRMDSVPYREIVGCLLYVVNRTRPDISYAVSILSRALNDQTKAHWKAAKRIVLYLLSTVKKGITIGQFDESETQVISLLHTPM